MDQKIYSVEEHQLPIEKVDEHALYVIEKLQTAGFVAYIVGGSVRDLLLDVQPKDFDISTSAKPEEIKALFRSKCILIGRRFRLAHIRFGKKIIEVATFRSGDPEKEDLILHDNQWGYPEEDALRRDFTINGLFYDPSNQTIIDYVGGFEDIKRKILHCIGQPHLRFKQDPVRMLRLLKFQARFNLEVDEDTHIAMIECRREILKSSQARILEEVLRMLESGAAKPFIQLMTDHGLMGYLIPDIASFIEKEGEEIYSYLEEIDSIFQDPSSNKLERPVLLSSLTYPILQKKLKTKFLDRDHIPHLGQIQTQTKDLIHDMYNDFFQLPRRLCHSMTHILTNQYRLTPLQKRKTSHRRIPNDPDFHMALKFLALRSCLEPGLTQVVDNWVETFESHRESHPAPRKPTRKRRRRRRRKTSE